MGVDVEFRPVTSVQFFAGDLLVQPLSDVN